MSSMRATLSNRFYDSIRAPDAREAAAGEATETGFAHLAGHTYCLFVSYKRDGDAVPTPVWFGIDDEGRAYLRSYANAAKLKRIRNNPRVRLAPCDRRGRPLGPAAEGSARVVPPDLEEHAERTVQSNYGGFRRVYKGTIGSSDAVYVEVTPA